MKLTLMLTMMWYLTESDGVDAALGVRVEGASGTELLQTMQSAPSARRHTHSSLRGQSGTLACKVG